MTKELYIGVMSGTSIDGLDACLIDMQHGKPQIIAVASESWTKEESSALHELCQSSDGEIDKAGKARVFIAKRQARVIQKVMDVAKVTKEDIVAIGTHGQTVRHRPQFQFSCQLDLGPLTAALTGIDTIVDFRAADLAVGGNGAPLTPAFHQMMLTNDSRDRYVLNLGGISNITVIQKGGKILAGFDCGPANTLLDLSCRTLFNKPYDKDANIALSGKVNNTWLNELLDHPYLKLPYPKSSGREDFNEDTIASYLKIAKEQNLGADLLATLCEFTVRTVVDEIVKLKQNEPTLKEGDLVLCGGGAFNPLIVKRFNDYLTPLNLKVLRSDDVGIHPLYLEAEAFAWFAYMCVHGKAIDLCSSTGAKTPSILGCICPAIDGYYAKTHA